MKKLVFVLGLSFLAFFLLGSCSVEDETPPRRNWYFKVQEEDTQIPIENAEIELTLGYKLGGVDYAYVITDENGQAYYVRLYGSVRNIRCKAEGYRSWTSGFSSDWGGLDDFDGFIYLTPR